MPRSDRPLAAHEVFGFTPPLARLFIVMEATALLVALVLVGFLTGGVP